MKKSIIGSLIKYTKTLPALNKLNENIAATVTERFALSNCLAPIF